MHPYPMLTYIIQRIHLGPCLDQDKACSIMAILGSVMEWSIAILRGGRVSVTKVVLLAERTTLPSAYGGIALVHRGAELAIQILAIASHMASGTSCIHINIQSHRIWIYAVHVCSISSQCSDVVTIAVLGCLVKTLLSVGQRSAFGRKYAFSY